MSEQELVENANIENDATGRIILDNIEYYSKKRQINKGDLERAIGVTPGFLSRYEKKDNGQNLSIGVLQAIAKKLDVPIISLLENNQENFNYYSDKISKFINTLLARTKERKVEWIETDDFSDFHPNGHIEHIRGFYFRQIYCNETYEGDTYYVYKYSLKALNKSFYALTLGIINAQDDIIYSTDNSNLPYNLDSSLKELYETIAYIADSKLVNDYTMNAINRYLNKTDEDDPPF